MKYNSLERNSRHSKHAFRPWAYISANDLHNATEQSYQVLREDAGTKSQIFMNANQYDTRERFFYNKAIFISFGT